MQYIATQSNCLLIISHLHCNPIWHSRFTGPFRWVRHNGIVLEYAVVNQPKVKSSIRGAIRRFTILILPACQAFQQLLDRFQDTGFWNLEQPIGRRLLGQRNKLTGSKSSSLCTWCSHEKSIKAAEWPSKQSQTPSCCFNSHASIEMHHKELFDPVNLLLRHGPFLSQLFSIQGTNVLELVKKC